MRTVETKRLLLRDWTQEDATDLYAYAKSMKVGPMAGWKPHDSIEESKQIIAMFIEEQEAFAIVHKETNKVIGSVGLHSMSKEDERELGYVISEEYWGQGIAKEAAVAAMKDLFLHENVKQVYACHFSDNPQSKRVIEKLGFTAVPDKNQTVTIFDGSVKEEVYYVITKKDFMNRYVGSQERYDELISSYHHMKIEQTKDYKARIEYDPETDSFHETEYLSLFYARNFPYPYGWITESGTPPKPHWDVILIDDGAYALGDVVEIKLIGVFLRNDGDHKLIAVKAGAGCEKQAEQVHSELNADDIAQLTEAQMTYLHQLYPHVREGEGFRGKAEAERVIRECEMVL